MSEKYITKKSKEYLSSKDLYCEMLVSKAKGRLTRNAEKMLILLGKNIIKKFYYKNQDDKMDCLQNGYTQMFQNWHNFDEGKSENAFAYFTEIFKRGVAAGYKKIYGKKGDDNNEIQLVSLDGANDGNGVFSI